MTGSCSSTPCKPQQASPVKSSPKSSPKLLRDVHPLFVDSQTVEDLADDMDSDSDSDDLLPPFTTFTTARKAVLSLSSYIEKICGQWKKFSTSLNSDRRLSRLDSVIVRTGTVLQQHQGNLKNLLFWVALNNSLLIQTCLKQTISWSINKSSTRKILPSIKDLTECHGYQTERPQKSKGSTGEYVPESCKQPVLQNPAL